MKKRAPNWVMAAVLGGFLGGASALLYLMNDAPYQDPCLAPYVPVAGQPCSDGLDLIMLGDITPTFVCACPPEVPVGRNQSLETM